MAVGLPRPYAASLGRASSFWPFAPVTVRRYVPLPVYTPAVWWASSSQLVLLVEKSSVRMTFDEATGPGEEEALSEEEALGEEKVLDRAVCCAFGPADDAGLLPGKTMNAKIATAMTPPTAIRTVVRLRS